MKKITLIETTIFPSALLVLSFPKAICQNIGKLTFDNRISEAAKGTKIDTLILKASFQRDSIAAENLKTKIFLTKEKEKKQPLTLEQKEISDILILNYERPELHVQYAETHLTHLKKYQDGGGTDLEIISENIEAIWQELEWFKIKGIPDSLKERITALRHNLPPRPSNDTTLTKTLLTEARKTFQSGKAIYIYYPENKPIEFEPGNNVYTVINMPTTSIRYIRSPQYPPTGCRVETY